MGELDPMIRFRWKYTEIVQGSGAIDAIAIHPERVFPVTEIIGKIVLGLGLMFTGVQMLSSGLKQIGSRQFRMLAAQFVSSRPQAVLFGLGSGMVLQSTSAALMILASLVSAGVLHVPQAISILNGFSIGNCVLLFIISLNISLGVMFLVGLCGIAVYLTKDERYRTFFLAGLGLGLIFFGLEMMVAGVKPLQQETWFTGVMAFSRDYSLLSVLAGMALGFIAQSSTAVALVAIGLVRVNILTGPQAFLFMYGAAIGSTMFKVVLGQAFRGTSRQLIRFVNIFNLFGAAVFILLYYLEVYLHVPLVMALVNSFKFDLVHQVALVFLLFNLTSAFFFIAIDGPLIRWLARSFPPTEEEGLSHPKFLLDFQPQDPGTGLELIRLEQGRELEQVAAFVSTAREKYDGPDLDSCHEAFKSLSREVAASMSAVATMSMDSQAAKDHAYFQTRQALLDQLADSTASGVRILVLAKASSALENLSDACVESIDFLLNFAAEIEKTNDPEQVRIFLNLSSSNGASIEQLRKAYMGSDKLGSTNDKGCLLNLTIMVEKIIWLLNRFYSLKVLVDVNSNPE
ncbi:MAG: Na/Pi symporter [Candidatus Ozemobacteraceae bacterium]